MSNQPLVSVIIPAYNHEDYIEECVTSVFNQSYENIECIIINDGSKDNTLNELKRLNNTYPFLLINQKNQGLCKTLNKGLDLAKGEYIAILASDDYWHPEKIAMQFELLNPSVSEGYGVCHSAGYTINQNNKIIGLRGDDEFKQKIFPKILINNHILATSALIHRSVFNKIGGYDESLFAEDTDFWIRCSQFYMFKYIREPLIFKRSDGNNLSGSINNLYRIRDEVHKKHKNLYVENNLEFEYNLKQLQFASNFNKLLAIKHLIALVKFRPSFKYVTVKMLIKSILRMLKPK